jgi:hypothetical protein
MSTTRNGLAHRAPPPRELASTMLPCHDLAARLERTMGREAGLGHAVTAATQTGRGTRQAEWRKAHWQRCAVILAMRTEDERRRFPELGERVARLTPAELEASFRAARRMARAPASRAQPAGGAAPPAPSGAHHFGPLRALFPEAGA